MIGQDYPDIPPGEKEDRKSAVKQLRSLIYTSKTSPEEFRAHLSEAFYVPTLPCRVRSVPASVDGVNYQLLTPTTYVKGRVIFYIHGGSFVAGNAAPWRSFCASLADESSSRLVLPDYRAAPSFPFPSALEDLQRLFHHVLEFIHKETAKDALMSPDIVIAADSSGGALALALILNLKPERRVHITHLVLFSPWVDLSADSNIRKPIKRKTLPKTDDVIDAGGYQLAVDYYTYVSNLHNGLVSPVYAEPGQFEPFPKVFIQMGSRELLLPDVERLAKLMEKAKVEYHLDVWPDMMHMFQMADLYLPQAHLAVHRAGSYIAGRKE
jgi:acetyl esterase/lipase